MALAACRAGGENAAELQHPAAFAPQKRNHAKRQEILAQLHQSGSGVIEELTWS